MLPRDASPGLLRRRYSVPETIMRRYKVSQQKTECEGSVAGSAGSASAGSGAGGRGRGAPSHAPHTRDRELMRRSALLRRMWGRAPAASSPTPASPPTSPPAAACCRCCCDHVRPSRSLDGSRADLRPRLSASTYRSHAARGLSSCLDTDTDRPPSLYDEPTSEAVTVEIESASELPPAFERSALSERVPRISSSSSTSHQSTSAEQDTEVHPTTPPSDDHSTLSVPNENHLLLTTNPIVAVETPSSCEMLEIVVTQTSEPGVIPAPRLLAPLTAPHHGSHAAVRLDIDRYVSDVLVESLNSLSDRLEYVTSSVEGDGKISVIEKEIKVKLHSTGVNTIVHLSPTSNNQIIFGNEELCDGDERDQSNNNPRGSLSIRDEPPRDDARNNNQPATPSPCPSPTPSPAPAPLLAPALMRHRGHVFEQLLQHDNVNKAVLQQIQKLFDEELQSLNNEQNHPNNVTSGISHIEISNVDVFLHENESSVVEMTAADTRDARSGVEVEELSGVGAGSYFETSEGVVVVPRFSALPHTDSMEVNTSSSEDADGIASECTSLVDSLDDPNSPRSVLIRRNFNNRKTELVRSAIDVLDLLPENTMPCDSRDDVHKDKPESFFITIKDNECECDKENFNVADRMPEKIKERLIRRHRRRQQRMECARRSRGTQHRDELYRTKREVERDCVAIINSLIDEVIAKIAKDEFKCARIKRKSDRLAPSKSDENYSRKNRKKNLRPSDGPPNIATKPSIEKLPAGGDHQQVEEKHQVRGKLSLMTRPPLNLTEAAPRRVYQKSEILEGNKCIEILEILEYVNGTQSSPGTPVSDDSPGTAAGRSGKRSRIPVPVTERSQRPQPPPLRYLSNSADNSPGSPPEPPSENTSVREKRRASEGDLFTGGVSPSSRRVLYPASVDTRPRSDSLRFRRVFDMIPEERSSVSVESSDVERAAPARTRSVATSPLPVAAAPPLRVKGGDMPRRARVWAPLGRREEGKPDKNDVKKASRPDTLPPTTTNLITNQHKRNNKTNTGKKITISKQREQHKPPPTPPDVRHHLDDTTDHQSSVDDKKPSDDSAVKTEEESTVAEDPARGGSRAGADSTSEGSDGGSDLLCSRWRGGTHRRRRTHHTQHREKGWSVTVAGSCAEALPADLEMRLRFPHPAHLAHPAHHAHPAHRERTNQPSYQCTCRSCVGCMCSTRDESAAVSPAPLPAPPTPPAHTLRRQLSHPDTKLTLTMKKEARDSSILASKSMRKSMDPLPELETFRSSRSKVKSSVKAVVSDATGLLPALLAARRRARARKGK